jgi:hypothetical protein
MCTRTGYYQVKDHGVVSYFTFPTDQDMRRKWIIAIKRDEGDCFKVTKSTSVCSVHFEDTDFREVSNFSGRRYLKDSAVPSVFKCWESVKTIRQKKTRPPNRLQQSKDRAGVSEDKSGDDIAGIQVETEEELGDDTTCVDLSGTWDLEESSLTVEQVPEDCVTLTHKTYMELLSRISEMELELKKAEEREKVREHIRKESEKTFCVDDIKDCDICFYTGFPDREAFDTFFNFVNPGENGENVIRYGSDVEGESQTRSVKKGRPFAISPRDQFLLFLCRVRLGLFEVDLSYRFGISTSAVSYVIITWANFLYLRLGSLPIWPSRKQVDECMPPSFKEKYPKTRVVLDCTEIKTEMPSSLVLKSKSYSSYKSSNTLKGLVGITPAGHLSFVSQLYTGCISDREITIRSGLLRQEFLPGDDVMADKGFDIQDLFDPLGVHLNIPPFLHLNDQMSPEDVAKTQSVAAERIHVERIINKVKNFHIFDQVIPLTLVGSINQIWTTCALLTLFQNPIISSTDT